MILPGEGLRAAPRGVWCRAGTLRVGASDEVKLDEQIPAFKPESTGVDRVLSVS